MIAAQEKEIAKFLAALPSEILKNRIETADQSLCYDTEHSFNELVSECWNAYFDGKNDPLRSRLNSGELTRSEYNFAWRLTDLYTKLWGLIQVSFEQIQLKLSKSKQGITYDSAFELFLDVVRDQADREFSVCLEPYYEASLSKLLKARRLKKKIRSGKATASDRKQFEALLPKEQSYPLLFLVLRLCNTSAARRERVMRERLEDIDTALERLADSIETFSRYQGSYIWKKGKFLQGQKDGGTYADA